MAYGGSTAGLGYTAQLKDEAKLGERFSVPVNVVSRGGINESKVERVCACLAKTLPALKLYMKHQHNIECFHVCETFSRKKCDITMDVIVDNLQDLENFYHIAKKNVTKELNTLSSVMTNFFQREMLHLDCGFSSTEIVLIKIVLQSEKFEKVKKILMGRKSPNRMNQDGKPLTQAFVKKTFIIHVPEESGGRVRSVKICCGSMKELNKDMKNLPHDMYGVEVDVPASYDERTEYWYEINTAKSYSYSILWFPRHSSKKTKSFQIGNSEVNRDVFDYPKNVIGQLQDIVHGSNGKFSAGDLIHQSNMVCQTVVQGYIDDCIKALSQDLSQPEHLSLVHVATLSSLTYRLPDGISLVAPLATKLISMLKKHLLSEFPEFNHEPLRKFCKGIFSISHSHGSSAFDFIDTFWTFLGDTLIHETLLESIKERKEIISATCTASLWERSYSLVVKYCENKEDAAKDMLEIFVRHCPTEQVVHYVCNLKAFIKGCANYKEDILLSIDACTKANLLSGILKAKRDKRPLSLLHLAVKETMLGSDDSEVTTSIENAVTELFSTKVEESEKSLLNATLECLNQSRCFKTETPCIKLVKSIASSTSKVVRGMFIPLLDERNPSGVFEILDVSDYQAFLETDIKSIHRNRDLKTLNIIVGKFMHIVKAPAVTSRHDFKKSFGQFVMEMLKDFPLQVLIQSINETDSLCGKEPSLVTMMKDHIRELLMKEVRGSRWTIGQFCHNDKLVVNTRSNSDLVSATIDMFLKEESKKSHSEIFSAVTRHEEFWHILKGAEGLFAKEVFNNKTYVHVEKALKHHASLFKHNELSVNDFSEVEKSRGAQKILRLYGLAEKDIQDSLMNFKDILMKSKKRVEIVFNSVLGVQKRNIHGVPDMNYMVSSINSIRDRIENGKLTVKECMSETWQWGEMANLPSVCRALHDLINSEVFWNVAAEKSLKAYQDDVSNRAEFYTLVNIRFLYGDQSADDNDSIENIYDAIAFLTFLNDVGVELYADCWDYIQTNPDIKMKDLFKIFENAIVPKELSTADRFLKKPITERTRTALMQIWESKDVRDTTLAIQSVIEAFGYEPTDYIQLKYNIASFTELLDTNVEQYKLCDMHDVLAHIFNLSKSVSPVTVDVMKEIGKSKQLIEFLQEIAVDDIRNLIDAVEDISECHVQESTVSALIEIRRLLGPLLNLSSVHVKRDSHWMFSTLENQMKTLKLKGSADEVPSKICVCVDNLHNLKSLYNNVANRGQQTKEIIHCVVKKGEFRFELDQVNEDVTYGISYKDKKNKYEKNETTLLDIRSRALLLLNTEKQSSESSFDAKELRLFVNAIDQCVEIKNVIMQLHSSGHTKYVNYLIKTPLMSLPEIKDTLIADLREWTMKMNIMREKYYLMNFLKGSQMHLLNNFIQNGYADFDVTPFLKFIHPDLSTQCLLSAYQEEAFCCSEPVEVLSRALHSAYGNKGLFCRRLHCSDCSKRIDECVQEGSLFVTQLEENSKYVVKTILALYHNTTHTLPEPNQVIFCSADTKWCDIELLLQRCKYAFSFYGSTPLYCLANVEKLQNEVQFRLIRDLQQFQPGSFFLLALICRGSYNNPFVDRLSRNMGVVQSMSDESLRTLLANNFTDVQTYTSDVAGLGKTSLINKDAAKAGHSTITLHISGKWQPDSIVERLMSMHAREFHVLHIDIGSVDDLDELDAFLFEMIVMRFVSAGKGAFYLSTPYVSVEIANSINNILRNSLPSVTSFKRMHLKWNDFYDFCPSMEDSSAVQVVCKYLESIDQRHLDQKDMKLYGNGAGGPLPADRCQHLLRKCLADTSDISFSIIHIFLNVLSEQLKKFSCSSFFKVSRIADMIGNDAFPNVRSSLVKSMVEVAREFASRSVNACRSEQGRTISNETFDGSSSGEDLAEAAVSRVDSMIRWEDSNHLVFVFHNQNIQTLSAMYRDKTKVPSSVRKMFETQMRKTLPDYRQMDQNDLQQILQRVARIQKASLNKNQLHDLSKNYAMTPDNLLKMVLIMMRIQSGVPVVIMGETGCGKTSLIRYLAAICSVTFQVFNIHAGTPPKDVVEVIRCCNSKCKEYPSQTYWLFLDEINTSENIGMICDAICHKKSNGVDLMPNLTVIGACNPYKLRSKGAIKTAGLSGKIKTDELSKLVYRVLPLPEMMVDYVWDFGSLSDEDEQLYIERMVEDVFSQNSSLKRLLRDLLSVSQRFVRQLEGSSCVVSLRDVYRCKLLTAWFIEILKRKTFNSKVAVRNDIKAVVLALSHCYHSRFMDKHDRKKYIKELSKQMEKNNFDITESIINEIIEEEQNDILDRMELPPGTAKNSALRENLFVILVCILNKIPIFVVGKPGCSKSLAMQVIRSNLRGKDSKDKFFKSLPQLYCVSFQGSESSTSDGIKKVFEKAENYQKSNIKDDILSVVLLDEIGLAEISRFNPLKVLHNLLEPDGQSVPNVAVVGISNWALDASKMNRAIHLSRPDMDVDELIDTSLSISSSFTDLAAAERKGLSLCTTDSHNLPLDISKDLQQIAMSYMSYTHQLQFKNFHGLRDFYSLVKFIVRNLTQQKQNPVSEETKKNIILEGLLRNFGGLKFGHSSILHHFQNCVSTNINITLSIGDLICSNINDPLARHLMVITKGESVLGIIERHLLQIERERTEIIFGSRFEEDLTDDYSYRILSRIILCMEQGIVLILKDLENIYGSLYDMLNQSYTRIGKKNNCRVALGPYSNPFCHVADSFRCIVIVEENRLDYTDPPFLNRFEKQYLSFTDVLNSEQQNVVDSLQNWIRRLTFIDGMSFSALHAFPYYNDELLVSLVLHCQKFEKSHLSVMEFCKRELMWLLRPEVIIRLERVSDQEIRDSLFDLQYEYFSLPIHQGLGYLINYQLENSDEVSDSRITIVFTNSNIHTNISDQICQWRCQSEKIGTFKSEKQLSSCLKRFWETTESDILFVHCNAEEDEKHLMLTKSLIEKYVAEYHSKKIVYIILHLGSRDLYKNHLDADEKSLGAISQINFLSGCKLIMLDDLESAKTPLSVLFHKNLLDTVEFWVTNLDTLKSFIFWAFTCIKFGDSSRNIESVKDVLCKIKDSTEFLGYLSSLVFEHLRKVTGELENEGWCVGVACDIQALSLCSSFANALEEHIKTLIKNSLAKCIYKMNVLGIVDCFFIDDDECDNRRSLWWKLVIDNKYFSIEDVPDLNGPESLCCITPDLALKMPFSAFVYNAVESTKDAFLEGVSRAKIKCEIDMDEELPVEVFNELKLQHEAFIASSVSEYFKECSKDSYLSLKEDYLNDFCNLYSFSLVTRLPDRSRIEFTKWFLQQTNNLKEENFLIFMSTLHCFGWLCRSTFAPALQLFELYSVMIDQHTLRLPAAFPESNFEGNIPLRHTNTDSLDVQHESKSENRPDIKPWSGDTSLDNCTGLQDEETHVFEYTENATEHADSTEKEVHVAPKFMLSYNKTTKQAFETTPICTWSVVDFVISLNNLKQFVYIVCQNLLTEFADNVSPELVIASRNIIFYAIEVSDESVLHKLRFCDDAAAYIIEAHDSEVKKLEPLGEVLQNNALDSEEVFLELTKLFQSINNCHTKARSRTLCQYLFRCVASNDETDAYVFLFQAVMDGVIHETEIELLHEPFLMFLNEAGADYSEILLENLHGDNSVVVDDGSCVSENAASETRSMNTMSFFSQLNVCLYYLHRQNRLDGSFSVMVVDLLQRELQGLFNDDDDDFCHLVTKAGTIMQIHRFSFLFHVAIAFVKCAISKAADVIQNENESCKLMSAINAVIAGLETSPLNHTLVVYFLKTLGQNKSVHSVMKLCKGLSDSFPCIAQVDWVTPLWPKILEYNLLAQHVLETDLKEAEQLLLNVKSSKSDWIVLTTAFYSAKQRKLLPLSLSMSEYYTQRYRQMLDDTQMRQAKEFLKICVPLLKSSAEEHILKFLAGRQNLQQDLFELNDTTSFQQYMINTSLLSLYCILLDKRSQIHHGGTSLLLKCLLEPSKLKTLYIPGVATLLTSKSVCRSTPLRKGEYALCQCNNRIHSNDQELLRCVVCSMDVQVEEERVTSTDHEEVAKRGFNIDGLDDLCGNQFFFGNMTVLSFHLIQLLIKGTLLGSFALGISNLKDLEELLNASEIDVISILEKGVTYHWESIKELTNLNSYGAGLLLHTLYGTFDDSSPCSFDTLDSTLEWEQEFERYISNIVGDGFVLHHELYQDCCKRYDIDDCSVVAKIRESDPIEKLSDTKRSESLPCVFRIPQKPSRKNFQCCLMFSREEYPLLAHVVLREEDLKQPVHLYNIMEWHLITYVKISYMMKKWQCADMSVREFLDKHIGKGLMKKKFKAFKASVAKLKQHFSRIGGCDIPSLSEDSKLHDCLMLDQECWLYKLVSKLIQIQSEFVDFCLMISFSCKNLQFLKRSNRCSTIRSVSVAELKKDNLIDLQFMDGADDFFTESACSKLAYGQGHVIKYDFHVMEKSLVYDIFVKGCIAYIKQSQLQFIVFKDELYRTFMSLLKDVNMSVSQQPLPSDLEQQVMKSSEDNNKMPTEVINHLDMILTLLKRTKCDPDTPLTVYTQKFKNMIGQDLPERFLPFCESTLQVRHVVSLHELFEVLCAEQVIDGIEETYSVEMDGDIHKHFIDLSSRNTRKAERIAKALKIFIYRCIYMCKSSPQEALHKIITDASFWSGNFVDGMFKWDGAVEVFSDVFPNNVRVCNVIPIVQLLNETIEKQREDDIRIDSVITSWKSKQTPQQKPTSKTAKTLKKR